MKCIAFPTSLNQRIWSLRLFVFCFAYEAEESKFKYQ